MSLAVQLFIGGMCRIDDIRPVKDDKGHMRVTLSYMGGSDEVLIASDVISVFRVGDMCVCQFEARKVNYNAQYGENTYIRSAYEMGRLTLMRKPTKEEF